MSAPYFDDLYSDLPIEGEGHENVTTNPQRERASSSQQPQPLHDISTSPWAHPALEEDPDEDIAQYLSPADGFHSSSSSGAQYPYSEHQLGFPIEANAPSTPSGLNIGLGTSNHRLDQTIPVTPSGPQPTSAAVPRIPNVLVEDPSLGPSSTADSKAREARRERERSGSLNTPADPDAPADSVYQRQTPPIQSSSSQATPQHHSRQPSTSSAGVVQQQGHSRQPSRQYSERTPLFGVPAEAPPAYTPSPTSPTTSQFPEGRGAAVSNHSPPPSGYQTFPNIAAMGREGEDSQWLLSQGGPESMANPQQGPSEEGEGFFYRRRKQMSARRNFIARLLFFALLVSVFGLFLAGVVNAVAGRGGHDKFPPDREEQTPGDQMPIHNPLPSEGRGPLKWEPSPQCAPGFHKFDLQHYSLDFNAGKTATLVETVEEKYPGSGPDWHLDVRGDVIMQRVGPEYPAGFSVEVLANSEKLVVAANWNSDRQSLTLTVPRVFEWHERLRPCIQMRVTASIPEGAELQLFQVVTVHLDVTADPDMDLKASKLVLETVIGDVRIAEGAHLDGRSISIHTVSGDVGGTLPLYDNLDIATVSGDVDCNINPQEADKADSKAANLEIGTMSGEVRIREPADKIPVRDYMVDIESYSGDLDVTVAASSKLVLETHSGIIRSNILPVLDPSLHKCGFPSWTVSTYSGDQMMSVRDPLWATGGVIVVQSAHVHEEHVLDCLTSSHSAISGDVNVNYPSSWSGNFAAQTVSGDLEVSGKDVVVDSRSSKPGLKSLKGHHYDGESSLVVSLMSGDVKILIGTE